MQLPAISSLVSLLSGSITGLKDLVTNATSLIAAAYFGLLHLAIIFPPLRDSGFLPIVAFERLPTVWQVVLGTLIFSTLAFILSVMGQSLLGLVNGRVLSDHVPELASKLKDGQAERFHQLWNTVEGEASNEDWAAEDAADKLAYEFPDEERDLAPTRLGNILLSPASYTYRQYGARLDTIWPILARKIDADFRKQIDGEMEAIIFLATMSVLSVVAALELALALAWFGDSWWSWLWCPVLVLAAIVFYYATFPKARAWGLGIRTAFDQDLDLAAKELGLRDDLTDPQKKQKRWREVSGWLSIGTLRKPSPTTTIDTERGPEDTPLLAQNKNWYKAAAEPPEPLTVKCPPNITASVHSAVIAEWPNMPGDGQSWRLAGQEIAYVIAVTNQGDDRVRGTSLQVMDTRLPALPVKVFGTLGATSGSVLEGLPLPAPLTSSPSLLWFLPSIGAGETQVLRYQIRYGCSIEITEGTATMTGDVKKRIWTIVNTAGTVAFTIDVMDQAQLASLYDMEGNLLIPTNWDDVETEHQAIKRATFLAAGAVRIQWDGQRFVPRFV